MNPADPAAVEAVGQRMRVDHVTLEVMGAMEAAGIEPVLLKGPAVADWLYDRRFERAYGDVDLLVAPTARVASRSVLTALGFSPLPGPTARGRTAIEPHAETWFRASDHAAVDLHRCLHGTEHVPGDLAWEAVTRDLDRIELFGQAVAVPSEPVRLLHVVLHLQPKDNPGTRAWTDVERAIERVDLDVWRRAVAVAAELDVVAEMGPLLRLVPSGETLADQLHLPSVVPRHLVAEHGRHAPRIAHLGQRLRHGEVRRAFRMAVPSPEQMRASYPTERTGTPGLVISHAKRLSIFPGHLRAWLRYHLLGGRSRLR